jgi:hypothetical protein
MAWTNEDGLLVRFGNERSTVVTDGTSQYVEQVFEIEINSQDLPVTGDINADRPHLPANALITDAFLIATEAFDSTGTLTVGLANSAGAAIDADGIDATVDVDAVLGAVGDVVACDGELVDKTATIGSAAGWVYASMTAAGTTGKATLKIKYIV